MITYLGTTAHTYTIEEYLETWGQPLAGRFRVESYLSLFRDANFEARPGTYIFSDIERLAPGEAKLAGKAWRKISDLGGEARILNHPTRSVRRYELLRTLFERGDNTFNVYRLADPRRRPRRWPVFIREEREHTKNLTPLLHTPKELEAAVAQLDLRGYSREDKLVVEFCDTHDFQGLYYKYGAFLIGERIIPSALVASRSWMVAEEDLRTPDVFEKERRYAETNPHERELREIFRLARIDYGRIDYAMLGNRLQVWEINTNPMIVLRRHLDDAERKDVLNLRAERLAAAFAEIDVDGAPQ